MTAGQYIPIIDVFAGLGGLGEGFSALLNPSRSRGFRLALSIEKDEVACRTLRLRAIRRYLHNAGGLDHYHALLRGEMVRAAFDELPMIRKAAAEAGSEVMNAELGKCPSALIDARIQTALGGGNRLGSHWRTAVPSLFARWSRQTYQRQEIRS